MKPLQKLMYFLCCSFVFQVTFLEERVSYRSKGAERAHTVNCNSLAQCCSVFSVLTSLTVRFSQ